MKKRVVIIIAVLLVLIGSYFALVNLGTDKNEDRGLQSDTISIFKTEKDNISAMTISTPDYEYTFYKYKDEEEKEKWKVAGMEEIRLDNIKVDNLAYDFASINASTVIDDASDLASYGFDAPSGYPSVKLADGTIKRFIVGSKTPTGSGYYFKTEDDPTVYTVYSSKAEDFIAPLEKYRDKTLASIEATELVEIKIKRSDADILIRQKTEEESKSDSGLNSWKMISPYERDVSGYNLEEIILKKITGFTVSKFIDDNPGSYAKYGLDLPKYVISFKQKDKEPVTFYLGNVIDDDNEVYVKLEKEKAVYTMALSAFGFRDMDPMQLIDTLVYIQMIDNVDSITLNASGKSYVLKITREGENVSYFINDKPAPEDGFKKVYQELIGLTIRGTVTEDVSAEPLFTAEFKFNNGRANDIIEGIPYKDRYAAIKVNGAGKYYVMKEQVLNMIEKVDKFSENPEKQ